MANQGIRLLFKEGDGISQKWDPWQCAVIWDKRRKKYVAFDTQLAEPIAECDRATPLKDWLKDIN